MTIYIQRTKRIYHGDDYDRPTTAQRETVATVKSYREAIPLMRLFQRIDPDNEFYTSTRRAHIPRVRIKPGKTYRNKHTGRTFRTVISVVDGVVMFTQPRREGEHQLSVASFTDWAGLRRHRYGTYGR